MRKWNELPDELQIEEVRYYYDILSKKRFSLTVKRIFDIIVSAVALIFFAPIFLLLAIAIKVDSSGPVFYRQERITKYGRKFKIYKFRTMVNDADKKGSLVTVKNDNRITRVGKFIRDCRLDEIGQLINVFVGDMTFVGTRPEVLKYVETYAPVMKATLLMPAGVTSEASILYRREAELLDGVEDADKVYIESILPGKMFYNLQSMEKFNFWSDIKTMCKTVLAVLGKEYVADTEGEKAFAKRLGETVCFKSET